MLAIEYSKLVYKKDSIPIYKSLISQIYVENENDIFYLSQCLKNDIYFEKIIFSENLKNMFKLKFNQELDNFCCKKEYCIKNYSLENFLINNCLNIFKTREELMLNLFFKNEIINNIHLTNIINDKYHINININSINNYIFLYDNNINYKLIINDICMIIIFSGYIVFYVKSDYWILSKELFIFSSNNILSMYKLNQDKSIIYGFIKNYTDYKIPINKKLPKISSNTLLSIKYDSKNDKIYFKEKYYDYVNKIEIYTENEKNLKNEYFKSFSIKISKGNILIRKENNNYIKNELTIISECTITDKSNGLRFRGKYENKQNEKGERKTILQKNGIDEYHEEDGNILLDKIKNVKINEDEYVIGWKAVKNINGEIRILKLGIDSDVKKIIPIDEEYYMTRGKERCEKAIVLDIQFPYKDEEISVVPNEMEAYSYIYGSANMFKYSVGKEINPDGFDEDKNNSCSNGIHYYRERNILFETYIL